MHYSTIILLVPKAVNPRRGTAREVGLDAHALLSLHAERVAAPRLGDVGMAVEGDDGRRGNGGMHWRLKEHTQSAGHQATFPTWNMARVWSFCEPFVNR